MHLHPGETEATGWRVVTAIDVVRHLRDASPQVRRSPQPQERQRDPERTRARILEAAAAEFGAHGFAGARVRAIAERAGVNQQLVSYYFDGKEGLYQAISDQWQQRQADLSPPGLSLPEQLRGYAREVLRDPDGVRMFAWSGLQHTAPTGQPAARPSSFGGGAEEIRALQEAGRLPADLDPASLLVMLMAAAMATTTLPQVIQAVCGADATSPEFVGHFADQIAILARHIGLES